MTTDLQRELLRRARLARYRRRPWKDFWAAHSDEIRAAFPLRAERAPLVDALGVGPPVEEIQS